MASKENRYINSGGHKEGAFLYVIVIYKFLTGFIEIAATLSFIYFFDNDLVTVFRSIATMFNLDMNGYAIKAAFTQAASIGTGTIYSVTAIIFCFGVINTIEGYGLCLRRRWAEWLTVIATSLLIPFEIYAIVVRLAFYKIAILVINVIIVYYLAKYKNLFNHHKAR